ncbi:MAG: protein kinase [Myxococcota bacterium]
MQGSGSPLTFGRYEALFHIASGGMAEVFAARLRGPAGFEKLVAVKRLLPDLSDDHFVTMFLDEARLAAHITSPHVVQTLELGRADDDGALYIVMELVIGVTLFELCVNMFESAVGETPIEHVVEIMAQAARGLDDAHNARTPTGQALHVVHRDISPQNILVGLDGRVRVTDFGIARAVSRSTKTHVGQLKGKVAYLSPEQSRSQPLDARSDVFAIGVCTWEALTGRSLFNTGDAMETVGRVRSLRIPDPRELRREVPESVARVVLWALERDLDNRCPSAAEYAKALREAATTKPSAHDIGELVRDHGGSALIRMKDHMNGMSMLDETAPILRRTKTGSRIVPEAAPKESSKLFPLSRVGIPRPSDPPQAERSEPLDGAIQFQPVPFQPAKPQAAPPSVALDPPTGVSAESPAVPAVSAPNPPASGASKPPLRLDSTQVRIALGVGVAAWLSSILILWWTLS